MNTLAPTDPPHPAARGTSRGCLLQLPVASLRANSPARLRLRRAFHTKDDPMTYDEKVRAAYNACAAEGLTQAETARKTRRSRGVVSRFASKHKLEFVRDKRAIFAGSAYRACAAEGLTQAETARKLDRSEAAVSRFASKHGVEFVRNKKAPRQPDCAP